MICENCGKDNLKGAVFCSFCGQKISSTPTRRALRRSVAPVEDEFDTDIANDAEYDDPPAPKRKSGILSSARESAVLGTGKKRPIPDRPSSIVKRTVSTLIPRRVKPDDFFDDIDSPDEEAYYDDRDARSRRRSIIAGIVLLGVMVYVFWLLMLPAGQQYRAQMGWGAPASAYYSLGERDMARGDANSAAMYYYDALRLDPDNYDYALSVATSFALLGNYETALSAYAKCISINPDAVEPYKGVSDVYAAQGDKDRATNALMTGFNRTGDLTLFRAYQQLNT